MATGVISLLIGLMPIISKLGLWVIDWFIKGQTEKEKAMRDFLAAIQSHLDDALKSVDTRKSAQSQNLELDQTQAQLDSPSPESPPKPQ